MRLKTLSSFTIFVDLLIWLCLSGGKKRIEEVLLDEAIAINTARSIITQVTVPVFTHAVV